MTKQLLVLAIALALFFVLPSYSKLAPRLRRLYVAGLGVVFLVLVARFVSFAVAAHKNPPVWDFRTFWVYGRVAVTSGRIYDPAALHAVARIFPFDGVWARQVLDVGFLYPPTGILLFAPLGLFSTPQAAAPYWYALNGVALLLTALVCWHGYLRRYSWVGFIAAACFMLAFNPTRWTFIIGQTMIWLLLFVLLFALDSRPVRRGVWLGLACVIKPLALPLLLEPALRRCWTELLAAAAVILAAFAGAIALVGAHNALAFFYDSPYARYPGSEVASTVSQGLQGVLLRFFHQQPVHYSLSGEPVFVAAALLITAVTIAACMRTPSRELRISLLIALALLVYPQSLFFYTELLLIPVLVLWNTTERSTAIAFAIAMFLFTGPLGLDMYFVATLLTWVACLVLAWRPSRIPRALEVSHAGA
jgi:hypothetical protein